MASEDAWNSQPTGAELSEAGHDGELSSHSDTESDNSSEDEDIEGEKSGLVVSDDGNQGREILGENLSSSSDTDQQQVYGLINHSLERYRAHRTTQDLVMVHGVCDNFSAKGNGVTGSPEPWTMGVFAEPNSVRSSHTNLLYFWYNTDQGDLSEPSIFDVNGIDKPARLLLASLKKHRQDFGILSDNDDKRPIQFISRDLGGQIVKRALVLACQDSSRYPRIAADTTSIIFQNCPNTVGSIQEAEDIAIRIIISPKGRIVRRIADAARKLAVEIYAINNEFIDMNMTAQARTWNLVSNNGAGARKATESWDCAYPLSEVQGLTTCPLEGQYKTSIPHHALAYLGTESNKDEDTESEKRDLLDSCEAFFEAVTDSSLPSDAAFGLRVLLSHCPPLRATPMVANVLEDRLWSWLTTTNQYLTWKDGTASGVRILHLQGRIEHLSLYSERLFLALQSERSESARRKPIFYFEFRKNDCRFNNTKAMLLSFLTQLATHTSGLSSPKTSRILKFFRQDHVLSLSDLMQLFQRMIFLPESEDILWFVSCVDFCVDDGLEQFIQNLRNLCEMSDIPFQFLVTGSSRESLRGLPIVELDSFLQDFGYQETRSETEILLSRQSLMSDLDTNARQSLSDLLGKFKHDNQLSHMILNWMKSRIEDPLNLDEAFGVIRGCVGLSAVSIYNILAQKVPTELRKLRDTASQLVLVSMQPLRPQELAAAIAIDDTTAHGSFGVAWSCSVKRTLRSLLQVFPGQFILKNNEVHIAHDAIRQELTAVEESALNSHIAKRCLRYLSLPPNLEEMQQMVESLHDAEMALTWPRNSWTAYAVKYFADHYRLSGNLRPVKEAMQFFECRKTGPLWSEAYNAIPNQFGRMDCGYLTALPILARTGLVDLVEAYVNRHKESLRADEAEILPDCWLAAIEASHQGNMPILRILLDKSSLDASQWCRVISAASESGEAQLIHHLIDSSNIGEIQETLEDASWLRQILLRSAWLGHTEIVEKLLKLGVKLDPTGEERHEEDYPLWISIVGGHRKMTKLLLNAEVSQPPSAPRLPDFDVHGIALEQASAKGDPEIVRLLVERASVLFTNAKIDDAIRTACISGCFKALEALLLTSLHTESRLKGSDASEEPWLISAAKRGFLSCARVLLESGANIHMEYSGQTALHVAVNHGSLEMARFFLMHGADPNRTSESIELPLTMAVKKDDLAMVELLLDHGADIEKEDETDEGLTTALASAASIVNDGIFYLLRNRGADINHVGKGSLSRSPIFAAAWRTDPDALGRVTDLIEAGADVNMVSADPDKWTVLHAAYDNPKVLPVLLGTGVDVNQLSGSGSSVLFMAARWGYKDSVTALLNYQYDGHNKIKVDLEFYSEEESELNGMTPLCVASKEGNVEIMRLLLEAGADAVHQSSDGSSPLLLCLRFQHRHDNLDEAVSVILDHIPVTAMSSAMAQIDKNGDTILHAIDCSDSFHVAKRLIHMGADLSARSKDGCTPLMKAIVDGNYDLAAFLVSQGADIHLGSYERGTPLHLACKGANLPLVKLLVDAGADVNKLDDRSGESVLQACMVDESGNLEVAKYLVEERNVNVNLGGGRYVHPLINNSRSRSSYSDDIAELLIKHHADVNAQDVAGRTPIHHCMQAGSWLLDTLLKLGADPEAKDKLGRTALHYAAAAGHDDHVESVLNTGRTGVDTPDLDGWTPLLWSCRGARRLWFEERCELLIKSGASLWARGRGIDGTWSPLKVARYFDMTPKSFHTQLEPDEKHRIAEDGQVETWEDDFHQSKRGWIGAEDLDCSGCFASCRGVRWRCANKTECPGFLLCFVCYKHKSLLHPNNDHKFEDIGMEYEPDPDLSEGSTQDDTDANSTNDDEARDKVDEPSDVFKDPGSGSEEDTD